MPSYLSKIHIEKHDILGNLEVSLINPLTNKPYSIVVFVGENGCGKTTLLNEISKMPEHHFVFLRQNSMFVGLSNESYKLITGKDGLYPIQNNESSNMDVKNSANNKEACVELLKSLNDDALIEIYESGKLDNSRCGGEASRVIDGRKDFFDLNTLSSGQQEILLKLKTLKQAQITTDYVLLDEPETSLHPRWQKRIVYLVRDIVSNNGNIPQLFVATHSEKVLESIIGNKDALIVGLYKENNEIKVETISEMDLRLPTSTFAELDYVVFHIPSLDYHDQLLNRLADLYEVETIMDVDKKIRLHSLYTKTEYGKIWNEVTKFNSKKYHTLPAYIRNYFHHPKEDAAPTEEEIVKSIEFLRTIIKSKVDE